MMTHYRWEHPLKQRYYQVILAKDLFGEWVITRVWGGIGKATGRITHLPCSTYDEGIILIEKISKTRLARGYETVQNITA
jgi:hypothetical protein